MNLFTAFDNSCAANFTSSIVLYLEKLILNVPSASFLVRPIASEIRKDFLLAEHADPVPMKMFLFSSICTITSDFIPGIEIERILFKHCRR